MYTHICTYSTFTHICVPAHVPIHMQKNTCTMYNVYMCIHTYMYTHMYISCVHKHMCTCTHVHVYICVYIYVCIHICVHVYICVYIYVCIHICVHVHVQCTNTCQYKSAYSIQICIHTHIHSSTNAVKLCDSSKSQASPSQTQTQTRSPLFYATRGETGRRQSMGIMYRSLTF
jgi:hypothetical protein